jgi:hypothetical protein
MSVLINEFEIVPASEGEAAQRPDNAAPPPVPEKPEQLQAPDVHRLMERRRERLARVWAH